MQSIATGKKTLASSECPIAKLAVDFAIPEALRGVISDQNWAKQNTVVSGICRDAYFELPLDLQEKLARAISAAFPGNAVLFSDALEIPCRLRAGGRKLSPENYRAALECKWAGRDLDSAALA